MRPPLQSLDIGDRAPNFALPNAEGKFTLFYERTKGRPMVLLFLAAAGEARSDAAFQDFLARSEDLEAAGLDVFCVQAGPFSGRTAADAPFHLWSDPKSAVTQGFLGQAGLPAGPAAFLLDPNQRILGICSAGEAMAAQVLALFRAQPGPERSEQRPSNAPVLLMPNLLSAEFCADLIALWQTQGHEEGTVGSVLQGAEVDRVYGDVKRRLDHRIMDPALNRTLQQILGRRIAPEVHKAFQFEGFRFDRFLVVCYDAARGDRFRPHRDNLSPETSDRRFAMTLNLNSSDYEGGELVFPEYGPHRYKPGDGGAVIFSCSLIHEALPVTKGRRFALLTFLRALPEKVPG